MGMDYAYIALQKEAEGFSLVQARCVDAEKGGEEKIIARQTLSTTSTSATSYLYFRVSVSSPDAQCRVSYNYDGNGYTTFGEPFKAKEGKWIGAKLGLFCLNAPAGKNGGYTDIDWFRVQNN
jgi:hypothetical protein